MPYQYKREPLTPDEANRLASACETHEERLIVWTLLDTGLRVSELAGLTREHIDWQNHRLMIYGKGGIYGTKSKRRVIPLTNRVRPLIDHHFAIYDTIGMTPRTIQRILKRIANKAHITRPVSPHVLRHTFAVAAVQKGISLPALQRLLGHDRLTTTEIYLNLSPEDVIRGLKTNGRIAVASSLRDYFQLFITAIEKTHLSITVIVFFNHLSCHLPYAPYLTGTNPHSPAPILAKMTLA